MYRKYFFSSSFLVVSFVVYDVTLFLIKRNSPKWVAFKDHSVFLPLSLLFDRALDTENCISTRDREELA
jgi:hypothetical protein